MPSTPRHADAPTPSRIRARGPKDEGALAQSLPSSGCARALLSLALFPTRVWAVRELMRAAALSPSQVTLELLRLVRLGVLTRRSTAEGPRYAVVTDHQPWRCYLGLVRCHATPAEVLQRAIGGVDHVVRAMIFGSFAADTARDDSDVDLLVIGDGIDARALAVQCLAAANLLGRDVRPVVLTSLEWKRMRASHHPFARAVGTATTIPLVVG